MRDKKNLIKFDFKGLKKKNLKYFTFEDAIFSDKNGEQIRKHCWMYMINIDKNTGKTTEQLRMMNEACRKIKEVYEWNIEHPEETPREIEDRFLVIFRSGENEKEMNTEYNNVDYLEFKHNRKRYVLKEYPEVVVGKSTFLGTGLQRSNGQQFKGYKYIFFDEYRSKVPLSPRQMEIEFDTIGTFISTFLRNKHEIYFYLFGNNEAGADLVAEQFEISKDMNYLIDKEEGLAYFNFGGCFEGLRKQQKQVQLFTKYSPKLKNYIDENIAMESKKGIITKEQFEKCEKEIDFQVMFRKKFYNFYKTKDEFYLVENDKQNLDVECYGILAEDFQENAHLIEASEHLLESIESFYRSDLILLWRISDRDYLTTFLERGLSTLRLQKELGLML